MKSKINELSGDSKNIWNLKQTYLTLANLMNAAAELKIDATPMEGFSQTDVNAISAQTKKIDVSKSSIEWLGKK